MAKIIKILETATFSYNYFGRFRKMYYLCIRKTRRRVGRVIDRAGLEIRYTLFGYRGFESLTLRNKSSMGKVIGLFFMCANGNFKQV